MGNAILFIIGGVVLLIAVVFFFWYRAEQNAYYASLTGRYDIREFIERKPRRPEPEALLIGSIISAVVAVALFVAGIIGLVV
jgi:RsiW-degrading membrane proteinase PrsW (M82 family)